MKYITTLALLLAVVFLHSCSKKDKVAAPVPGPISFRADFQSEFDHSRVQYFVDDWQVFDGNITTRRDIGLAHTQATALQSGLHRFRVVVDGRHSKDTTIDLSQNLYLGVNHNAGEIRFLLSDQRWNY